MAENLTTFAMLLNEYNYEENRVLNPDASRFYILS
mgnify:CR=1 FL=1